MSEVAGVYVDVRIESDYSFMDGSRNVGYFFLAGWCLDRGGFTAALYQRTPKIEQ